jgi:thiol-disulfide isomerase/thioredoxin
MHKPGCDPWAAGVRALRGTAIAGLLLAPLAQPVRPAEASRAREAETTLDRERVRRGLQGVVLKTVDGRSLALDSLQGQVVVLNFWASWCPPCRRELPHLDALQASLAGRGARVVAISIDEEARNVQRFARAERLSLPLYHDGPDHLARRLDLPHVPFTIVLDRRGEVAFATSGADDRALEMITETTQRLIAVATTSSTLAGETP